MIPEKDVPMPTLPPLRVSWRALLWASLFPALASCGESDSAVDPGPTGPSASVAITSGPSEVRQGDVVGYTAETRDAGGSQVADPTFAWSVSPASAGLIAEDGRFVGYTPGSAWVVATGSGVGDSVAVTITARGLSGTFSVLGHREVLSRNSSHISVHGTFAYTGTINCERSCGDRLLVWNISDPANPTLTDAVVAGGTRVNDVMVRADGAIAAMTNEGGLGGITLLDLSDPAHPTVITRLTEGLEPNTHNLWIEGERIYVVGGNGLFVVDITNLPNPAVVANYKFGSAEALFGVAAHDVQVRDGLAMISNWEAGLIILDVGGGGAGGSPANAIELSRTRTPQGWTHNAWYWPATGYVFIGEEPQVPGVVAPTVYVMDAREPRSPELVATYSIPGFDPHNFWLDEDGGILYVAWRGHGIRALDVTGTLMGRLELQGRQIAGLTYDVGDCDTAFQAGLTGTGTCSLSVQVRDGLVYVSDITSGLWVLQLQR